MIQYLNNPLSAVDFAITYHAAFDNLKVTDDRDTKLPKFEISIRDKALNGIRQSLSQQ